MNSFCLLKRLIKHYKIHIFYVFINSFRYVVSRYLEEESPFFNKIFPPTYSLSTSQTPLTECADMPEVRGLTRDQISALRTSGGGFGPVADNGYGVSYIFSGEHQIAFHISSKKSAQNTVC
jgi:carnitine O-palmitoyltransferase 1, liver isoform